MQIIPDVFVLKSGNFVDFCFCFLLNKKKVINKSKNIGRYENSQSHETLVAILYQMVLKTFAIEIICISSF